MCSVVQHQVLPTERRVLLLHSRTRTKYKIITHHHTNMIYSFKTKKVAHRLIMFLLVQRWLHGVVQRHRSVTRLLLSQIQQQ